MNIINVKNPESAAEQALKILNNEVSPQTVLFLSGGSTPYLLYQKIAEEGSFSPDLVALVDERYGDPFHDNSNEKMIHKSGFFNYLEEKNIPVKRILRSFDLDTTANKYNQDIQEILSAYNHKVAVMGIGADAHTAGIKPDLGDTGDLFVIGYKDINGKFGQRVTITFKALSKIDTFIIIALGSEKKPALQKMLSETDKNKYPAVFFNQTKSKVFLITDQEIT